MKIADKTSLVDIHNHLVHGVDDGARDVAAVLESIERLTREGIRRVITTPHIDASLTLAPERLGRRLEEVSGAWHEAHAAIREAFPEVEYQRGHEVLLDVPEPDFTDERIRMAGTAFVLIEWPRLHVPPGTPRVLRWIRDQGHIPIVAHPERYNGMTRTPGLPHAWREAGAYLQVNYGSMVGRYGSEARSVATGLLEEGLVHYLASDFHGRSGLKIYKREAWAELEERGGQEVFDTLARINPARLIEGEEPLTVPGIDPGRTVLGRLRGMMGKEHP